MKCSYRCSLCHDSSSVETLEAGACLESAGLLQTEGFLGPGESSTACHRLTDPTIQPVIKL